MLIVRLLNKCFYNISKSHLLSNKKFNNIPNKNLKHTTMKTLVINGIDILFDDNKRTFKVPENTTGKDLLRFKKYYEFRIKHFETESALLKSQL